MNLKLKTILEFIRYQQCIEVLDDRQLIQELYRQAYFNYTITEADRVHANDFIRAEGYQPYIVSYERTH